MAGPLIVCGYLTDHWSEGRSILTRIKLSDFFELLIEVSEVVISTIKTDVGDLPAGLRKQLTSMCDADLINEGGEGFTRLFLEVSAE